MPNIICNTSPLQYLHQIDELRILPALVKQIIVPPAVVDELATGRAHRIDLPVLDTLDWITVRSPASLAALPLITDMGPGETEVLALALELEDTIAILDDGLARHVAHTLGLRIKRLHQIGGVFSVRRQIVPAD